MPTGCFAPFPVTVPQWGSLTRVGRHIPQAAATAVPSLLAPGASFSAGEAAPRAAGQGRVGPAGLFLELMLSCGVLRRGPEDLLAALRGVAGVWARVSVSGYGLALAPAGTFQGEFKLWSPWEQVSNPGALHVLLQLWMWPWLGCALPRGTETWGGGCWGVLDWLQCHLHSGEARPGWSAQPPPHPGSLGSSEGSGASLVASCWLEAANSDYCSPFLAL